MDGVDVLNLDSRKGGCSEPSPGAVDGYRPQNPAHGASAGIMRPKTPHGKRCRRVVVQADRQ